MYYRFTTLDLFQLFIQLCYWTLSCNDLGRIYSFCSGLVTNVMKELESMERIWITSKLLNKYQRNMHKSIEFQLCIHYLSLPDFTQKYCFVETPDAFLHNSPKSCKDMQEIMRFIPCCFHDSVFYLCKVFVERYAPICN